MNMFNGFGLSRTGQNHLKSSCFLLSNYMIPKKSLWLDGRLWIIQLKAGDRTGHPIGSPVPYTVPNRAEKLWESYRTDEKD